MEKNLENLLELYKKHDHIIALNDAVMAFANSKEEDEVEPPRLLLEGCVGAQENFVIAAAFLAQPRTILIIANDKEEAAYLDNDLASLLDKNVHFLTDSFKKPMAFAELNKNNVLSRTEIISNFTVRDPKKQVIVTYPEALFEKVVVPAVLEQSRIDLERNKVLDIDFLVETLVEYGFIRADFVYEPGQFAIRGGIIDIFSYGNDMPYRIEMFDKDIETIRVFDPISQLSVQNIAHVTILPNINTHFQRTDKASLLKVLPYNTLVFLRNQNVFLDKLQACFEKAVDYMDNLPAEHTMEYETRVLMQERAFLMPAEVVTQLEQFSLVYLEKQERQVLKSFAKAVTTLKFNAKPQPSFNKNIELLIEDLRLNQDKKGLVNYIFTDNARQVERFYSIFEDLNAAVRWNPITKSIHVGFIDTDLNVACYTDHQIFNRHHKYNLRKGYTKGQALNIRLVRDLQVGDFVTHIDHGIGRYSGLETLEIGGKVQEVVRLIYQNTSILYVSINSLHKIAKYVGKEGTSPTLHKLGSDKWRNTKEKIKREVKDISRELIKLYAKRKAAEGYAFSPDSYLQHELEASFIYQDTPDQFKATQEVKADMEKPQPMDRLVCGDVGFGKTEVAVRAAFKAVADGKQVAILVPRAILAVQHAKTFRERLSDFSVNIDYINRFKTAKQKKEILKDAAEGKIEILIGTHALFGKEVKFKNLGLLIIDEEQKFGVAAKEKLREVKANVDTLTLTATPIPRTLQFSLMAARDLSVINTPPPDRLPIQTELHSINDTLIREAIEYELYRGGQVFFIHNRVQTLAQAANMVRSLVPEANVIMAHGQMPPDELENSLLDFFDKKYDVLVCTNIVDTGLDVSNANTMIINNAQQFGLSDLHQLRGRVGRSNRQAFCYLLVPALSVLTPDAHKRLKTLEEFSDLGSGMHIAMRDLDIRGAGNILGGEQSGFIVDIGYDTYQKILKEAVQELKESDFRDLFAEEMETKNTYIRDVTIEMDVEMRIPEDYVPNIAERLSLYTELDGMETEADLQAFAQRLTDRFGKLPYQVEELFNGIRIRTYCKTLGFERLLLKGGKLRCFFVTNPQSLYYDSALFQKVMQYPSAVGDRHIQFKEVSKLYTLLRDKTSNTSDVLRLFKDIERFVHK
jgi:transcription-repair coupling factor (superfamily II helicase)